MRCVWKMMIASPKLFAQMDRINFRQTLVIQPDHFQSHTLYSVRSTISLTSICQPAAACYQTTRPPLNNTLASSARGPGALCLGSSIIEFHNLH